MSIKADKHNIVYELDCVYITKDGKRFLNLDKAIKHQKTIKWKHK